MERDTAINASAAGAPEMGLRIGPGSGVQPASDDLISILEVAYRGEPNDSEWLSEIVAQARPFLDTGKGIAAFLFDASDATRFRMWAPVLDGADALFLAAGARMSTTGSPETVRLLYGGNPGCSTLSSNALMDEVLRAEPAFSEMASLGVHDILGIRASNADGRGAFILAPLARRMMLSPQLAFVWSRIAVHIASALRLRQRTSLEGQDPRRAEGVEAIVSPGGGIQHAVGDAAKPSGIDALTGAADAVERARGTLRTSDPEQALELWEGLVAGRWTLVDHFDHDGKRVIIARRNEPKARATAGLSSREAQITALAALGHSNKLIAYEMGLSISTIALHLSRASKKLGATSRVALIRAYKQLTPPPQASDPTSAPSARAVADRVARTRAEGAARGDI